MIKIYHSYKYNENNVLTKQIINTKQINFDFLRYSILNI